MPLWSITPFDEQHLDAVLSIEKASFKNPWQRNAFVGELVCDESMSYVVKCPPQQGGQVIAYVCLRRTGSDMHLLKVAVEQSWRERGIAAELLDGCFRMAVKEGVRVVHLEMRPANTAAQALYKKLGFNIIGKRPKYYTDTGEDALALVKKLKEA